ENSAELWHAGTNTAGTISQTISDAGSSKNTASLTVTAESIGQITQIASQGGTNTGYVDQSGSNNTTTLEQAATGEGSTNFTRFYHGAGALSGNSAVITQNAQNGGANKVD
ncbi:MAG: hypothetical protein ACK41O_12535, partial [Runella zeae]